MEDELFGELRGSSGQDDEAFSPLVLDQSAT
jgi:hypothetical protein